MSEIRVDTISEKTSANGVAIDSVTLKDGGITATAASTITTADNTDTLTLKSTDADAAVGPVLTLHRESSSPADDDIIGRINFIGEDSGGTDTTYGRIETVIMQESNGSEDATMEFRIMKGGTERNILELDRSEVCINEDSQDIDFRVESNSNTHMLFVEGGTDRVGINASSPGRTFTVGGDGIIGLEGSSNAIAFTDSSTLRALISSQSFGPHDGDGLGIATQTGEPIKFFTNESRRVTITSDGHFYINTTSTEETAAKLGVATTGVVSELRNTNASYGSSNSVVSVACTRTSNSAYRLLRGVSGNGSSTAFSDNEFIFQGNGDLSIDGSVGTGGADYAEMFEWEDGNSSNEDRRGYSVILNGNKIVKATSSDEASQIIGVVSAIPVVIGDSDIDDKWRFKYLKDDFGNYVMEDHTVTEWTDEDGKDHSYDTDKIPDGITAPSDATVISTEKDGAGNTINLQRKKLNPEWDSAQTYVRRQDRKEWDAIGLMGKLRLRKGQPTGTNWIKMRDISDTVEEWLVR